MAEKRVFKVSVSIPTVEEFAKRFPQYGPRAEGEGGDLFGLIMNPGAFISAKCATEDLNLPAVAGVAKACAELRELSRGDKPYVGALVCVLMETNGFEKTGRKRAIPHPQFTKGEVYRKGAQ